MSKSVSLGFPVFCLTFTPHKPRLIVGGGGGATKAGVKNTVLLFHLDEVARNTLRLAEQEFSKLDDGCMSVAVHPLVCLRIIHPQDKILAVGVNSPESVIKQGANLNCRIFSWQNDAFTHQMSIKTVDSLDPFHHQKVIQFSPDGNLLLTGTTEGKLTVWQWPSLTPAWPTLEPNNEIYDATFDPSSKYLLVITANKCLFINSSNGKIEWKTESPVISNVPCEFRAARFGTGPCKDCFFVVCNAKSRKQAFICKYVFRDKGWKLSTSKSVSNKPITAFTASVDGELLAFGSADLSVNILTSSFHVLLKLKDAHGFPVTALTFSPTSKTLVSGSADGTCVLISVPLKSGIDWTRFWILILILLTLVMVIYVLSVSNEPEL